MSIFHKLRFVAVAALVLGLPFGLSAQATGKLKTSVTPGRAGVFVDGKYLGPAANFRISRTYTVAAGEHELKLVDPRYEEFTTKITIVAGKTTKISEKLKPLPLPTGPYGMIRVIHPDKFAEYKVRAEEMGFVHVASGPMVRSSYHADEISISQTGGSVLPLPSTGRGPG